MTLKQLEELIYIISMIDDERDGMREKNIDPHPTDYEY